MGYNYRNGMPDFHAAATELATGIPNATTNNPQQLVTGAQSQSPLQMIGSALGAGSTTQGAVKGMVNQEVANGGKAAIAKIASLI